MLETDLSPSDSRRVFTKMLLVEKKNNEKTPKERQKRQKIDRTVWGSFTSYSMRPSSDTICCFGYCLFQKSILQTNVGRRQFFIFIFILFFSSHTPICSVHFFVYLLKLEQSDRPAPAFIRPWIRSMVYDWRYGWWWLSLVQFFWLCLIVRTLRSGCCPQFF